MAWDGLIGVLRPGKCVESKEAGSFESDDVVGVR